MWPGQVVTARIGITGCCQVSRGTDRTSTILTLRCIIPRYSGVIPLVACCLCVANIPVSGRGVPFICLVFTGPVAVICVAFVPSVAILVIPVIPVDPSRIAVATTTFSVGGLRLLNAGVGVLPLLDPETPGIPLGYSSSAPLGASRLLTGFGKRLP